MITRTFTLNVSGAMKSVRVRTTILDTLSVPGVLKSLILMLTKESVLTARTIAKKLNGLKTCSVYTDVVFKRLVTKKKEPGPTVGAGLSFVHSYSSSPAPSSSSVQANALGLNGEGSVTTAPHCQHMPSTT